MFYSEKSLSAKSLFHFVFNHIVLVNHKISTMKYLVFSVLVISSKIMLCQFSNDGKTIKIEDARKLNSYDVIEGDTIKLEDSSCDFDLSVSIGGSSYAMLNKCRATVCFSDGYTSPLSWNEDLKVWEMIKISNIISSLEISYKDGWFRIIDIFEDGNSYVRVFYFDK